MMKLQCRQISRITTVPTTTTPKLYQFSLAAAPPLLLRQVGLQLFVGTLILAADRAIFGLLSYKVDATNYALLHGTIVDSVRPNRCIKMCTLNRDLQIALYS